MYACTVIMQVLLFINNLSGVFTMPSCFDFFYMLWPIKLMLVKGTLQGWCKLHRNQSDVLFLNSVTKIGQKRSRCARTHAHMHAHMHAHTHTHTHTHTHVRARSHTHTHHVCNWKYCRFHTDEGPAQATNTCNTCSIKEPLTPTVFNQPQSDDTTQSQY